MPSDLSLKEFNLGLARLEDERIVGDVEKYWGQIKPVEWPGNPVASTPNDTPSVFAMPEVSSSTIVVSQEEFAKITDLSWKYENRESTGYCIDEYLSDLRVLLGDRCPQPFTGPHRLVVNFVFI